MTGSLDTWTAAPTDAPRTEVRTVDVPAVDTECLEWSFNPWRERPAGSWAALAVTIGCVTLLFAIGMAPLTSLVLGLAVGATVSALLLPVRCRIDRDGVARSGPFGWERRRWEDLKRAGLVRGGVLVSPFSEPQPLDRFRALLLPVPAARRGELVEQIRTRLAGHGLRVGCG